MSKRRPKSAVFIDLSQDRKFIAVGPNCYGIGKTFDEAIKFGKSYWMLRDVKPKTEHFSVYVTDDPAPHIHGMDGAVEWAPGFTCVKLQKSTMAK